MDERAIVQAALEIRDAARRSAYLNEACSGDNDLRTRISVLLASYEGAGLPTVEATTGISPNQGDTVPMSTAATVEKVVPGSGAPQHAIVEEADRQERANEHVDLAFLQPPAKPGSLGRLAHYDVLQVLGHGAFGIVLKAFDGKLCRLVAVKIMGEQFAYTSARERFLREARAAAAIRHAHIVDIYSVDESPVPYIVMEYLDGVTLQQKLNDTGPLEVHEVLRIGRQIAGGLAAAHAMGIVHRDLKPANIMVQSNGDVKILDFGMAKISSEEQEAAVTKTAVGTVLGTIAFMAPEQVRGEDVDDRADIWALGVVLYELLTGQLPFRGGSPLATMHAVLTGTPRAINELRPDTPQELTQVIVAALEKDVTKRRLTANNIVAAFGAPNSGVAAVSSDAARPRTVAWFQRPNVILPVTFAVVLVGMISGLWLRRDAQKRWVEESLLTIKELAAGEKYVAAFELAKEIERYAADDPTLADQWSSISRELTVNTTPPGAAVFYREYGLPNAVWYTVGKSPIENIRIPLGFFEWKAELPGYRDAEDIGEIAGWSTQISFMLEPLPDVHEEMVRVSTGGYPFTIFIPGLEQLPAVTLCDFWMDRHEVTNRQFKRFVTDGGYHRPELWPQDFVKDGHPLARDEAMQQFVDATGRPGPATWEMENYPAEEDDYPVTGVSWYEAAAYAAYAGKQLPTIYHWCLVACQPTSGFVVPVSNFTGRGAQAVGQSRAKNRFGVTDMAGNVKEWAWNYASNDRRYILGGAWNEPVYMFTDADAQSPFARGSTFGFRCIKLVPGGQLAAEVTSAIEYPYRDYRTEHPVSDEVFRAYQSIYSYDRTDLSARVESTTNASDDCRCEKVTFAAAYNNERVMAYLFLPTVAKPPYQTIIYFPGAGAISTRSSDTLPATREFDWILRSGRAVLHPIYKGTFERGGGLTSDYPNMTNNYRDHIVMMAKDLGRAIDYLESRTDIDHEEIGLLGHSWGASMGAMLPAIEPRIKVAILVLGGLYMQRSLPEADIINFLTRVRIPVLMLNGRYDFFYPTAGSQEPMFDLLGSPKEDKQRLTYDTGHAVPRLEVIRESLRWFDHYLGTDHNAQ